ncbi:PepSY domain-containing protein [Granulicella sp. 5B5]|uniref:PepSY domain-containing protein n=1 Tax=Granulicella sp. 5B5 TaxID=1617967 RepID=UPI0015F42027|nr:PepSY domain-containing protein [Granulicella sp. 5B5]QMV17573.1 PepSY domain-containing protein [Granulicella sp. 5B5]
MTTKAHATLRLFRQLHLYIGIFISPALLFFAFTGALQTFSLHESVRGSDYKPAHWVMVLAQIHKNQSTVIQQKKPGPPPEQAKGNASRDGAKGKPAEAAAPVVSKREQHVPLKIFFLLVSLSLMMSTLTGIYMAYKFVRNRVVVTGLLVAGVLVPLALLPF